VKRKRRKRKLTLDSVVIVTTEEISLVPLLIEPERMKY
jgi:hypothetical protein